MGDSSQAGVSGRVEAANRLVRITHEGAFAGLVGTRGLPSEVERLATELVGGVTRWRRWLDHLAASCYRGRYQDLEPLLIEILRIGTYDLAVAQKAPHAAVHQAVEAARRAIRPGAGKLVNAVLRALDRKQPWTGAMSGKDAASLSIRWSHPEWLVARWLERFGVDETRALMAHNNQPPVFSLRVARDQADFEAFLSSRHVRWERSKWLDDYLRLERLQPVIRGGWLGDGRCAVQDESAGLVVRLLDPRPGETVIDACAAPGGKARYIAEKMAGQGLLIAVDASESRLSLLENLPVTTSVRSEMADFRAWAQANPASADRVLVDAPCTGLGVLASRADLRWRRSPEDFERLGPLQGELLEAGARAVRPGGLLVYSTCSIAPEENEHQARAFLESHPEFVVESATGLVSESMIDRDGFFASLPQRDGIDGAFGVRFRRLGD